MLETNFGQTSPPNCLYQLPPGDVDCNVSLLGRRRNWNASSKIHTGLRRPGRAAHIRS